MEDVVGFNDVTVPPGVWSRNQQTEANMGASYTGRSLDELCNVVRHSGEEHRIELIHVNSVRDRRSGYDASATTKLGQAFPRHLHPGQPPPRA
jgi:hypothetical protein